MLARSGISDAPVASLAGVSVRRGRSSVVADVNVDLTVGTTVVMGANGVGKSTLLMVLATLISPDRGRVIIAGNEATTRRGRCQARASIGYLAQEPDFPRECTVAEAVAYAAWLRRIDGPVAAAVDRTLHMLDLGEVGGKPLRVLSGGVRQRVFLAQAMVHQPALLVLDEPTVGLDLVHAAEMRSHVAQLADTRCVVLATHMIDDIVGLDARLLILRDGAIAFDGRSEELAEPGQRLSDALAGVMSGLRC